MKRTTKRALALGAGLAVGVLAVAGLRRQSDDHTETVPYTVVAHVGDVELRRYPRLAAVETVAASENQAFRRLFGYIAGGNEGSDRIQMTAPVELAGRGSRIEMTAPVEVSRTDEADSRDSDDSSTADVRMAFFLPAEYSPETAPQPTDDAVDLVSVPERTLAVRRFSWVPTAGRIASEREALLSTLADAGIETTGEPFFMGYDAPWTLPFRRRNEVAVEVEAGE